MYSVALHTHEIASRLKKIRFPVFACRYMRSPIKASISTILYIHIMYVYKDRNVVKYTFLMPLLIHLLLHLVIIPCLSHTKRITVHALR